MKARDTANPTSRFAAHAVVYEDGEGPPPSSVTLLEDRSRSILSRNDSPDLPFRWSANPYRGCLHACAYCLHPDTPVLLADGNTRRIVDLNPGDAIFGTAESDRYRRYVPTVVRDRWSTHKLAYRITRSDGIELVASGDHRFLTERGWKYVAPSHDEHLTPSDRFVGPGTVVPRLDDVITWTRGLGVARIEPIGEMELVDLSTGTGDFIANGVVSHNCYARPTHEYLELGAGTGFDTKIVVKREAPELLREAFDKPSWKGESVMFSGVTDCYQAIERDLQLTRRCLEVCLEYRNPVSVISKSALVERDVDLFQQLAKEARFGLAVSLAFTDHETSRAIEPWAASPDRRFKVIETMAKAGVPVGVMCAPIIPGVNDRELVGVLERAAGAGAAWAGWVLLRLPGAVKQVFEERVRVALPLAADKVLHRIRDTRGGKLYKSEFHTRGRGEGPYADAIANVFEATCTRLGLNHRETSYDEAATTFRRPDRSNQLSLF